MRNVKGPKSALSDFIEENGITLRNSKDKSIQQTDLKIIQKKTKSPKKLSRSKPFEVVNLESAKDLEEEKFIENIIENYNTLTLNDDILRRISIYLSKKRKLDKKFFDFLVENVNEKLVIFDCSKIKNNEFDIFKDLKSLELFQCGQIKSETLKIILSPMKNLETLKITGAFLIEDFDVPKTIKSLNLTNCSRLNDKFIENINKTHTHLDELIISYCYGFSKDSVLTIDVNRLFICETKLTVNFFKNLKNIKELSVKRCPNISSLPELSDIEYLDVEGIVDLLELPKSTKIYHLNISYCQDINNFVYPTLKYLNISHINLNKNQILQILSCRQLEVIDLSWNSDVDDLIVEKMANELPLIKIFVFGCFLLTNKTVELSYKIKDRCLIVGNPSETQYLLNN